MSDDKINNIIKSLNESADSIQRTAQTMRHVAQRMQKTKQKLQKSMKRRQEIYRNLNLHFFHENSCFSIEERVKQLENNYIIVDEDENLIIRDSY